MIDSVVGVAAIIACDTSCFDTDVCSQKFTAPSGGMLHEQAAIMDECSPGYVRYHPSPMNSILQ